MRCENYLWPLCGLLLLVLSQPANQAQAAIYKQVLPDGSVIFSDQQETGATEIEISPAQGYQAPRLQPDARPGKTERRKPQPDKLYREFQITSPEDETTIRQNAGNVEVNITLQPGLNQRAGHRIVLTLDNKLIQSPTATTHILLKNVDRGTHKLQALIEDAQGKMLMRSPIITFHLFRFSRLLKPARRP